MVAPAHSRLKIEGMKLNEAEDYLEKKYNEFYKDCYVRLQYLNNVDISKDDIKTASEFGQYLLDSIFQDMSEVSPL